MIYVRSILISMLPRTSLQAENYYLLLFIRSNFVNCQSSNCWFNVQLAYLKWDRSRRDNMRTCHLSPSSDTGKTLNENLPKAFAFEFSITHTLSPIHCFPFPKKKISCPQVHRDMHRKQSETFTLRRQFPECRNRSANGILLITRIIHQLSSTTLHPHAPFEVRVWANHFLLDHFDVKWHVFDGLRILYANPRSYSLQIQQKKKWTHIPIVELRNS